MATISIGDIIRAVVSFSNEGGSVAQMVFWYILEDATAESGTLFNDFQTWAVANIIDEWADVANNTANAFLLEMDVINTDGTVDLNIGADAIDVDGKVASDSQPAAVAGFVQAETTNAKSRGRKYLPFMSELDIDFGLFDATAVAKLAGFLVDYFLDVTVDTSATMAPGVLSRPDATFYKFTGNGLSLIHI